MEKLKLPSTLTSSGSPASRRSAEVARRNPNDPLPRIFNRSTDVDIPRSAWSAWIETGKRRQLRRELTVAERADLERRRDELAPMMLPICRAEAEVVRVAIEEMFGSFRSMRQSGPEAAALSDATFRMVREFPAWAVEKACRGIQHLGVWRTKDGFGAYDRQWPPNDSEIVAEVRKEVRLYGEAHRHAVALLEAEVER